MDAVEQARARPIAPELDNLLQQAGATGFNQWLQLDVLNATCDIVEMEVDVRPEMRQPLGAVHGGCLGALADVTCAYATLLASHRPVVTSSYSIHFLIPAHGPRVRVTGRVIKLGKKQATVEARLFDLRDPADTDPRLCAQALATVVMLQNPSPIANANT